MTEVSLRRAVAAVRHLIHFSLQVSAHSSGLTRRRGRCLIFAMKPLVRLRWITFATLLTVAATLAGASERREIGNVILENVPDIPERLAERLQPYLETRGASLADWRPDGEGMLILTRFAETAQVHEVLMAGGARSQLTFYPERVGNVRVRPHSDRADFLYLRDSGGDEQFQLYLFQRATGTAVRFSDGKSRTIAPVWDEAGDRIAFASVERNGRDWDIWLADAEDPDSRRMVYEASGFFTPASFSPDGTRLLLNEFISSTESRLHLLNLQTGEARQIDDRRPEVNRTVRYGAAEWTRDGEKLWLVSDRDQNFRQLRLHNPATGEEEILTGDIPWNVESLALSPDGGTLAFNTNEDGLSRLRLLDTSTLTMRPVPGLPVGLIGALSWHPGGERLGMVLNTSRSPGDIHVLNTADGSLERWTYSEVGGLDTDRFVVPDLIHYPTFDEVDGNPRQISAWKYRPEGDGPHPVLIFIHGGPASQTRPGFNPLWQFLVNELGVCVIAPNVRGSSGYGRVFVSLDDHYRREDSVMDIGALLDWIETRADLDAGRIITMGGSYGGYMVYATHVHYGNRLAGGISSVGISNFVTFLENTADYRRDLRRVEYGDERDPRMRSFLQAISPLTNAHRIRRPMLIAQGANDPRVPLSESEQMVERIRQAGSEPWYFLAMDEGHGFAKKSNADLFRLVSIRFMETIFFPEETN